MRNGTLLVGAFGMLLGACTLTDESERVEGVEYEDQKLGLLLISQADGDVLRTQLWDQETGTLLKEGLHSLSEVSEWLAIPPEDVIAYIQEESMHALRRSPYMVTYLKGHASYYLKQTGYGPGHCGAGPSCAMSAACQGYWSQQSTIGPNPLTINWGDPYANYAGAIHDWAYTPGSGVSRAHADYMFYTRLATSPNYISRILAYPLYQELVTKGWLFYAGSQST